MNPMPGNHDVAELLPGAALETLEGEELTRVLAHARECAECGRLLEDYRSVAAALALELPPEPLDSVRSRRLKSRLLARAKVNPSPNPRREPATRRRSRLGTADRWAGWAVAASLVGILLMHHGFHRPLAYGWVVAGLAIIALVAFVVYAILQRDRVSALEDRLAQLEREQDAGVS